MACCIGYLIMGRILVIDDEFSILRVLQRVGTHLGYEVVICKTAEEAMNVLKVDNKFDLVLTDIILPGVSGLEFLEWLEKGRLFKKVVIMTAYPQQDFVKFALSHGALDVLTKPFSDLASLGSKMRHWISGLDIQPNPL